MVCGNHNSGLYNIGELMDKQFEEQLEFLNNRIIESLQNAGVTPHIEGNLFYEPRKPINLHLDPGANLKRKRIGQAVQNRCQMFEIGINGGHSSFLALYHNPELIVHANDYATKFSDFNPQIYCVAACEALCELFPGRFHYVFGNCLSAVPQYLKDNPELQFDIVHIDGNKDTYTQDFHNLRPALTDDALVIFDDYNIPRVQSQVNQLINKNLLTQLPEYDRYTSERYTNDILGLPQ